MAIINRNHLAKSMKASEKAKKNRRKQPAAAKGAGVVSGETTASSGSSSENNGSVKAGSWQHRRNGTAAHSKIA